MEYNPGTPQDICVTQFATTAWNKSPSKSNFEHSGSTIVFYPLPNNSTTYNKFVVRVAELTTYTCAFSQDRTVWWWKNKQGKTASIFYRKSELREVGVQDKDPEVHLIHALARTMKGLRPRYRLAETWTLSPQYTLEVEPVLNNNDCGAFGDFDAEVKYIFQWWPERQAQVVEAGRSGCENETCGAVRGRCQREIFLIPEDMIFRRRQQL